MPSAQWALRASQLIRDRNASKRVWEIIPSISNSIKSTVLVKPGSPHCSVKYLNVKVKSHTWVNSYRFLNFCTFKLVQFVRI